MKFNFDSDYDYYRYIDSVIKNKKKYINLIFASLDFHKIEYKGKPIKKMELEPYAYTYSKKNKRTPIKPFIFAYEIFAKRKNVKEKFKKYLIVINSSFKEVIIVPENYIKNKLKEKNGNLNVLLKYYLTRLMIHKDKYIIEE